MEGVLLLPVPPREEGFAWLLREECAGLLSTPGFLAEAVPDGLGDGPLLTRLPVPNVVAAAQGRVPRLHRKQKQCVCPHGSQNSQPAPASSSHALDTRESCHAATFAFCAINALGAVWGAIGGSGGASRTGREDCDVPVAPLAVLAAIMAPWR